MWVRSMTKILDPLRKARTVAILRHSRPVDLVGFINAMVEAGWSAVEITMDTPGSLSAIAACRAALGNHVFLGAGTVHRADDAKLALDAGAQFVVSAVHVPEVVDAVRESTALCIPGALTPNEIHRAWEDGADVVKVFPARALAQSFIADVRGPLGYIPLLPTGSIDVSLAKRYLQDGAVAVGVGKAAIDVASLEVRRWKDVTRYARQFLDELWQVDG